MKKYIVHIIRHLEAKLNRFVYLDDILYFKMSFLCLKVKLNELMDTFRPYLGDQEVI